MLPLVTPARVIELARRARADVGPAGSAELDLADDLERVFGRGEPRGDHADASRRHALAVQAVGCEADDSDAAGGPDDAPVIALADDPDADGVFVRASRREAVDPRVGTIGRREERVGDAPADDAGAAGARAQEAETGPGRVGRECVTVGRGVGDRRGGGRRCWAVPPRRVRPSAAMAVSGRAAEAARAAAPPAAAASKARRDRGSETLSVIGLPLLQTRVKPRMRSQRWSHASVRCASRTFWYRWAIVVRGHAQYRGSNGPSPQTGGDPWRPAPQRWPTRT